MIDDESLSQGYRLLAGPSWSLGCHVLQPRHTPGSSTQTLTSVGPGGSSAASQRDTKSTLTSPRSLGLRNPIRWILRFNQTDVRSFPCYTKNYYLVLLTKVYNLVSRIVVFLTKVYYLVLFPVNLDWLSVISQFKPT